MRQLLIASAIFFVFPAYADAYKCKDDKGKITYQGSPCATTTTTVSKIYNVPDASISDQNAARQRVLDEMEKSQRKIWAEDAARKRQEVEDTEKRKMELMERQARAAERAARPKHCTPDYAGGMYCN